jgi:sporulation protein YlmC with PRC-barrel domain
MMQTGATTISGKPLEMGSFEEKDVITTDGRYIGVLKGGWVDTSNWTVTSLVIELDKAAVDELQVKKPALRSAIVTIPTSYVGNVSDVIQLNSDMATLSNAFSAASLRR